MKKILSVVLLLVLICTGYNFTSKKITERKAGNASSKAASAEELKEIRVNEHVAKIRDFLKENPKYSSELVFLIDMKIASGRNRFFIYDLKKEKISDQGLVAHGSGSETGILNKLKFSNENGSNATSLGKYSIGESYHGQFGKSYKLYGLDKSNSNAFSRYIVLHKFSRMPYEEQINPVCNSLGCPMVNEKYFARIEKILDSSHKKILLDIYY